MKRRLGAITLACMLVHAGKIEAQGNEPSVEELSQMNLEQLLGVVHSASRSNEARLRAPASVTVLDRKGIERLSVRTVPDLLRTVPGVQVVQTSPGNFVVALRGTGGLNGNNVVVLLDGVPLNNALDAEMNWGLLPVSVDSIERIEVVRGPVSTIYGANAYTGVISIETRRAPEYDGVQGHVMAGGGTDTKLGPLGEGAVDVGFRKGENTASIAATGRWDGTFAESDGAEQPALKDLGLHGRGHLKIGSHGFVEAVIGGAVNQRAALDYLVLSPVTESNQTGYGMVSVGVAEATPWLSRAALWTRGRYAHRDSSHNLARSFAYTDTSAFDGGVGGDLELSLPKNFGLALGGDASFVNVDAPFIHPAESGKLRTSAGGYLRAKVDIAQRLQLAASGRLDASAFADKLQQSLRVSAVYYRDRYSLRLAAANAFRNPTFVEIAGRFRDQNLGFVALEGKSGLSLPRMQSVEAGAMVALSERAKLEVTAYLARASHLMVADFTDLTRRTFRNERENNEFAGGEFDFSWDVSDRIAWDVRGAYIHFFGKPQDAAQTVAIPEHNSMVTAYTGLSLDAIPERLRFDAGVLYLSSREYNLRAGVPPVLLQHKVPDLVRFTLGVAGKPSNDLPLWLRLNAVTHAPHGEAESPLPNASQLGTRVMLLADYRFE